MIKFLNILFLITISQVKIYSQNDSQIKLVGFEPSECQEEFHVYNLNNRIVSIEKYSDTTMVEISVRANCCINLIPNIIVTGDTIDLDFDYYEPILQPDSGDTVVIIKDECECDCCFSFRYYLTGIIGDNIVYRVNETILEKSNHRYKVVREATFDLLNGDTINYIDIFGFKQGLHRYVDTTKQIISERYFCDNEMCHGLFWRIRQIDGTILTEYYYLKNGNYKMIEYYNDRSIKKECILKYFLDNTTDCPEYIKGERFKE